MCVRAPGGEGEHVERRLHTRAFLRPCAQRPLLLVLLGAVAIAYDNQKTIIVCIRGEE
jgi:hypothetical protein